MAHKLTANQLDTLTKIAAREPLDRPHASRTVRTLVDRKLVRVVDAPIHLHVTLAGRSVLVHHNEKAAT